MSDLTHDQARLYIEAAAENRLGKPERLELDQHLAACSDCRIFAGELDELEGSLAMAFHQRWDAVPVPAASPRLVTQKVRRVRLQRSLWTAAQVMAGAAAIFFLIFAMENLVGPKGTRLPTPRPTLQAALPLPSGTPNPTYVLAQLPQATPSTAPTGVVQDATLTTQPSAIFYLENNNLYRKQYGQDAELLLDLTGKQPDEGKVLAGWVLADQVILLREPGLQRVRLPKGTHEWIVRLDKTATLGAFLSASNGNDLVYTASIKDPTAPFGFATRIGIYHIPEGLIQPVLSIQQSVVPLGYALDQKSLYVQPVSQDPSFDKIWRISTATGKTLEEISLIGSGYGTPAVSPDGRWLLTPQQKANQAPFLGGYYLAQKPPTLQTVPFSDLSHAADPIWSENGQRVYFVLNPGDSMVDRSQTETNIWSTAPGKWTLSQVDHLPVGSLRLVSASPDGNWLYLQGENSNQAALVDTGQGLHGLFQVPLGVSFAGWQTFTLLDPRPAQTTPTPQPPAKPYIFGKVVNGYGDHAPAGNLPLALDQSGNSLIPLATTDAQGQFTLSGIALGQHTLQSTWFNVPFTLAGPDQALDLGVIKYPLVHPPQFVTQKPSTAPDLKTIQTQGKQMPFQVIFADPTWKRPSESEQRDQVWAHQPFVSHGQIFFDWWFKQPAVLYDTLDIFTSGVPGGPDLSPIGADWRYLLGLWNTQNFFADSSHYTGQDLNDILQRRQLEIWLMGYQADEVRQLGDHYLVSVHPAAGVQVIRFQGNQAALAVHIVAGDQEIIRLPKVCRSERDLDCGSEGS